MRRAVILASLFILAAADRSRSEVSVLLDPEGAVQQYIAKPVSLGRWWGKFSSVPVEQALNINGDARGDQVPTCGVIPLPMDDPIFSLTSGGSRSRQGGEMSASGGADVSPNQKGLTTVVVAWARNDGPYSEIVYSLWDYNSGSWREPAVVAPTSDAVDKLDPWLHVRGSYLYLLWWQVSPDDSKQVLSIGKIAGPAANHAVVWSTPTTYTPDMVIHNGAESFQLPPVGQVNAPTL